MQAGRPHCDRPFEPLTEAARREFDIRSVLAGARCRPVLTRERATLRYARLLAFSRARRPKRRALVVAPLAGGFPFLVRDLVIALLRDLDEVLMTDWPDARYLPLERGRIGFDQTVCEVAAMIRAGAPGLHVIGVCQGAVSALMATALLSAEEPSVAPSSLVLMAGPIDPLANPTGVVRLLRARPLRWFEDNVIATVPPGYPGEGRRVYPASTQLATLMAYTARHVTQGGELGRKLLRDDGDDPVHFPFSKLVLSLMDLPAEFFLENIQAVFKERVLTSGTISIFGRMAALNAIRNTGLMTIEGEGDDIAAPGQTRAAHGLCPSVSGTKRRHLLVPSSGHFSLFHGEACRSQVVPAIVQFVATCE
jgi:poly(3-hydroxybutyrate) depolymerase